MRTPHHAQSPLNIFANWFEETHKTDEIKRPRTERDASRLWDEAPMYDSMLTALFVSLTGMEKEVDEVLEAEIAGVSDGC